MGRRNKTKVADPSGKTTESNPAPTQTEVRLGGSFNHERVCPYLQTVPINRLDGLWSVVLTKMEETGAQANPSVHTPHAVVGEPSGNLGGIVNHLRQVTAEDTSSLVLVHAILAARFAAAGYTPKPNDNNQD